MQNDLEKRIYDSLMASARNTSGEVRTKLGMCVMFSTPWEKADDKVKAEIRKFIEGAKLNG